MQILKAQDYHRSCGGRYTTAAQITLSRNGLIRINRAAAERLGVQVSDIVILTKDEHGDYFIGHAHQSVESSGFKLRAGHGRGDGMMFQNALLVKEIIREKDLCISEDKKRSIAFSISDEYTSFRGMKLFQIQFTD